MDSRRLAAWEAMGWWWLFLYTFSLAAEEVIQELVLPAIQRLVDLAEFALLLLIVLFLLLGLEFLGVLRDLLGEKYLNSARQGPFGKQAAIILCECFEGRKAALAVNIVPERRLNVEIKNRDIPDIFCSDLERNRVTALLAPPHALIGSLQDELPHRSFAAVCCRHGRFVRGIG